MDQIRLWTVGLVLWLAILFHFDRFHEPIHLAPFIQCFAAGVAIGVLSVRGLAQHPALTIVSVGCLHLLLKSCLGLASWGPQLPITVTELSSLALTVMIARQVATSLEDLQSQVEEALGVPGRRVSFDESQHAFYREVRRARRFERPLVLLAIRRRASAAGTLSDPTLGEEQLRARRRYVHASLAELLLRHTKDSDLVAYDDERLVLMLPETREPAALRVAQRVRELARQQLAINVSVGLATFPDQARTLDSLITRAMPQQGLAARHVEKPSSLPLSASAPATAK